MRVVCRMGREVLDLAALAVRPGVRCSEIDTIVHEVCMERKCYPSPLNYRKFPCSVCTSVNEVRNPHTSSALLGSRSSSHAHDDPNVLIDLKIPVRYT